MRSEWWRPGKLKHTNGFHSFPSAVLLYRTSVSMMWKWLLALIITATSFYSMKDTQHPGFISMSRCFICSFHNETSWCRPYHHITLCSSSTNCSSTSTLEGTGRQLCARPPALHKTHMASQNKKKNKSVLMHNYTMTLRRVAHIVLKAIGCFTPAVYMIAPRCLPQKICARVGRHHLDDP